MTASPIRVATAALSKRIFAGRAAKDGCNFKGPRQDVTSDVLVAIRDKVGIGNEIEVATGGKVEFRIAVLPAEPTDELIASANALHAAGLLTHADYHRTLNRIEAMARLQEA